WLTVLMRLRAPPRDRSARARTACAGVWPGDRQPADPWRQVARRRPPECAYRRGMPSIFLSPVRWSAVPAASGSLAAGDRAYGVAVVTMVLNGPRPRNSSPAPMMLETQ